MSLSSSPELLFVFFSPQCLKLFVESHGYSMQSNELVALYPTRNLSHMKAFASLESAKLFPKDTVFVQEK